MFSRGLRKGGPGSCYRVGFFRGGGFKRRSRPSRWQARAMKLVSTNGTSREPGYHHESAGRRHVFFQAFARISGPVPRTRGTRTDSPPTCPFHDLMRAAVRSCRQPILFSAANTRRAWADGQTLMPQYRMRRSRNREEVRHGRSDREQSLARPFRLSERHRALNSRTAGRSIPAPQRSNGHRLPGRDQW